MNDALFGVSRSAMGNRWMLRDIDQRAVSAICQRFDISNILARVLAGRGVDVESAADFLSPTLRALLPDPFHLLDMDKAAQRLAEAIEKRETIGIFGDYDVDGATSSALLIRYLRHFGLTPLLHIPDRIEEGYGPNAPALLALQAKGAKLVITVDCGAAAHAPLQAAQEAGMEIVVIDHHIGDAILPPALAVVNPNRFDETSPYRHMAAVGVTFLFLVAANKLLREKGISVPNLPSWLDMVALGTVCDVVPLTGINRAFVAQGLKVLAKRTNMGLAVLSDIARLDEMPSAYHLGFILGPRINAGGRVGKPGLGAALLACDDYAQGLSIAVTLDRYNAERKTLESLALEEAMKQAEECRDDAVIIVGGNWHPGVIGIIAGRIKERFHKPAAVIAWDQNGSGKASARSVTGVDFGAAVVAARQSGLLIAGGGHAMAAGFTIEKTQLETLREFFQARLSKAVGIYGENRTLTLDAVLTTRAAATELVAALERAGPYGMGNAGPRFAFENLRIAKMDSVGDGHIRCFFEDGGIGGKASGGRLQAIAFRAAGTALEQALMQAGYTNRLHVAGSLKLNRWQGNERIDLHIEDVCFTG